MGADYIIINESINFGYKQISIEKRKHGRAYRLRPSKAFRLFGIDEHGYFCSKCFKVMKWVPYGTVRKLSNYIDKPFSIWHWNEL